VFLDNKRVVITGGTGSLGKILVKRILTGEMGKPSRLIIFSRDEAKQHAMRLEIQQRIHATEEIIFEDFRDMMAFQIGDVRDFHSISGVLRHADIVINAAALKQVPNCEYAPYEAVQTNISGAENIVRAIRDLNMSVEAVLGVSTDKACKPVNVMGMTKAIQERLLVQANMEAPQTRFVCVRYGNVLASRGSVIPLFLDQIRRGGPVSITTADMTRFLLSLDQAVDLVFAALREAEAGDTYIPRVPSARIVDVAKALIGSEPIEIKVTGVRPGEKTHEVLISEEEAHRSTVRGKYYAIRPILPELRGAAPGEAALAAEYSAADNLMSLPEIREMLEKHGLTVEQIGRGTIPGEILV